MASLCCVVGRVSTCCEMHTCATTTIAPLLPPCFLVSGGARAKEGCVCVRARILMAGFVDPPTQWRNSSTSRPSVVAVSGAGRSASPGRPGCGSGAQEGHQGPQKKKEERDEEVRVRLAGREPRGSYMVSGVHSLSACDTRMAASHQEGAGTVRGGSTARRLKPKSKSKGKTKSKTKQGSSNERKVERGKSEKKHGKFLRQVQSVSEIADLYDVPQSLEELIQQFVSLFPSPGNLGWLCCDLSSPVSCWCVSCGCI